jgi:dTDP-glucose 4,6-dehydratase
MRTWFITGGAGFIGSAFVRLVLDERPDVRVIDYDALTYAGNPENLSGLDAERHTFVRGDICDADAALKAIPDGAEIVVNFAAESHVDRSILSANEFIRTNVLGTQVLLDAARAKGVRRFCQISTDEVMGSLLDESDELFTEESPFKPNSPYAASKAGAEHLVRAARETFGLDTVITRCGNNYGPRQFPEKFVPLMISNALADQAIPVYGDGKNVRDWIYVDDHCRAILDIIDSGTSGGTYNIGARNERHNIDVVKSVLAALGKPESLITYVDDRLGHDRRYAIDPAKVETELGWRPRETWESGLEKTIRWYIDNQEWTERIRSGAYRDYYQKQYGMTIA